MGRSSLSNTSILDYQLAPSWQVLFCNLEYLPKQTQMVLLYCLVAFILHCIVKSSTFGETKEWFFHLPCFSFFLLSLLFHSYIKLFVQLDRLDTTIGAWKPINFGLFWLQGDLNQAQNWDTPVLEVLNRFRVVQELQNDLVGQAWMTHTLPFVKESTEPARLGQCTQPLPFSNFWKPAKGQKWGEEWASPALAGTELLFQQSSEPGKAGYQPLPFGGAYIFLHPLQYFT